MIARPLYAAGAKTGQNAVSRTRALLRTSEWSDLQGFIMLRNVVLFFAALLLALTAGRAFWVWLGESPFNMSGPTYVEFFQQLDGNVGEYRHEITNHRERTCEQQQVEGSPVGLYNTAERPASMVPPMPVTPIGTTARLLTHEHRGEHQTHRPEYGDQPDVVPFPPATQVILIIGRKC